LHLHDSVRTRVTRWGQSIAVLIHQAKDDGGSVVVTTGLLEL